MRPERCALRSAAANAGNVLAATSFVEDLDRDVGSDSEDAPGLLKGAAAQILRSGPDLALREFLAPEIVIPIRDNFPALMGRRVRLLNLSDSQRRVILYWARAFRSA